MRAADLVAMGKLLGGCWFVLGIDSLTRRHRSCANVVCLGGWGGTPMNDTRDVELNAIGVLNRREIEARLLAPFGRRFKPGIRPREGYAVFARDNCGDCERSGHAISANQWGQQPSTIRCGTAKLDQRRCAGDRGARPERGRTALQRHAVPLCRDVRITRPKRRDPRSRIPHHCALPAVPQEPPSPAGTSRLLAAFAAGHDSIADDFVFPSPDGHVLDPDNLFHRYFLPVLAKAGLRRIRLHDLRHTFGSLLIQDGATLTYVKEQMGHSSIQVTVDIYGHLVPGANVSFVDRLDQVPPAQANRTQTSANRTQTPIVEEETESPQLIDSNWWRRLDSNQRPTDYETVALTT